MDKSEKTILFVVIGVVVGCLVLSGLCAAIFFISNKFVTTPLISEVPTPAMPTVAVCSVGIQDSKQLVAVDKNMLQPALQSQNALESTILPTADLNKSEERLRGLAAIPTQLTTPPVQYQIGDRENFYKLDGEDNEVSTSATLEYTTDNVYFWVEDGITVNEEDLITLVDTFSNQIYPTDHAIFGTEWIPGVDNDPHLFILYANGLGESLAGYASSTDYVLPEVYKYSNAHEMFSINADVQQITDPYTLSTMAHELQHVIQGYRDPDEELWLNEGFSELATLVNGYDAGGFDYYFTQDPDFQLNNWSSDPDLNDLNYGASYMFTTYFYGRFGEDITRDWASNPFNGFDSLDKVFQADQVIDPTTGSPMTADTFFQDWTVANFINDQSVEEGRYFYSQYLDVPVVDQSEWLNECDGTSVTGNVHQFGADYLQIACNNPVKLQFSGNPTINILPDNGENLTNFMWSNRGDSVDTLLTREFDLSDYSGGITMTFDTWYDLEEGFDYGYLLASQDGQTWRVLDINYCDDLMNAGTNLGCTYSGSSGSWITQTVNLSEFAGTKVWLRFEMVSDGALSNEGIAIDNIKIPEIGYEETFETSDGGWISDGFSRIQNAIPQTFLVSIITSNADMPVKKYTVSAGEELDLQLDPNCFGEDPILVVSGSSRYTRQEAQYTITLTE
jgi:immune inhibitor A